MTVSKKKKREQTVDGIRTLLEMPGYRRPEYQRTMNVLRKVLKELERT